MNIPKDILDWPVDHAARVLWDNVISVYTGSSWNDQESGLRVGFRDVVEHLTRTAVEAAREYAITEDIEALQLEIVDKNDQIEALENDRDALLDEVKDLRYKVDSLEDDCRFLRIDLEAAQDREVVGSDREVALEDRIAELEAARLSSESDPAGW